MNMLLNCIAASFSMKKTIALVDPLHVGHHLAFMRLFAKSLIDSGQQVIILYPNPADITTWLQENLPNGNDEFFVFEYDEAGRDYQNLGRFNDTFSTLDRWFRLRKQLKKHEKQIGVKIDFVFLAWLDSYLANYLHPRLLNLAFPYPWSGLYFHPRHLRYYPDKLNAHPSISEIDVALTSSHCKNVAIHDEGITPLFNKRLQKPVILFPEIADDTAPALDYLPAKEIPNKAKQRIVVGITGILDKMKGLLTLVRVAKNADAQRFFFVFAGPLRLDDYQEAEQQEITDFIAADPENCHFELEYIQEGGHFNAILNGLDVVYLVYDNFASSSNRLTKAAIFQKYVLAQNRFCVGEDTQKYNLGETVEEGNVAQTLEALDVLENRIKNEPFPVQQFEIYREKHSVKALDDVFKETLRSI